MPSLFPLPLDLLCFIHGMLVFLCAGTLEFARGRKVHDLPWGWLILSSTLHGLSVWCMALKYNVAFSPYLTASSLIFMLSSQLSLLEFSRRSLPRWRHRRTGWLSPLVVLFAISSYLLTPDLYPFTLRSLTLLLGGLCSYTLIQHSKGREGEKALRAFAYGILIYFGAMVTSSMTNAKPYVLAREDESLIHLVSLSIDIAAAALMLIFAQRVTQRRYDRFVATRRSRSLDRLFCLIFAVGVPGVTYLFALAWEDRETQKNEEMAQTYMVAFRENIISVMQRATDLTVVGSRQDAIVNGTGGGLESRLAAERALKDLCLPIAPAICYVMDANGMVQAASNHDFADSLERQVFGFREYFNQALKTGTGSSFHIGLVTHKAGFYAGRVIFSKEGIPGVLVVKIDLAHNRFQTSSPFQVFLVNREEQVFVSGNHNDVGRPLFSPRNGTQLSGTPLFEAHPNNRGIFIANNRILQTHRQLVDDKGMTLVMISEWAAGPARALAMSMCMLFFSGLLMALVHQAKLRGTALLLQKTKEAEQRLLAIVENAPDFIGIATLTGEVVYMNPSAQRVFLEPSPSGGRNSLEHLFPPQALETLRSVAIPRALETGFWTGESAILTKGSRELPVSQALIAHKSDDGGVRFLSTIIRDMSDAKRMERERERMQTQLFHAGKLASIGTLAAGIAHEINNPLAIILGFVRVMEAQLIGRPDAEPFLEILGKQERAVQRISGIVNGLKTFARIDSDELGPMDVHASIRESLELVSSLLTKEGIFISLCLDAKMSTIAGNTGKLQQVVINLLTNARDAVELVPEKRITISTRNADDFVIIQVTDSGAGIDPDTAARIFDPFFTTKDPGKGTGLGLSISHNIIASMMGRITVESTPGAGTTFSIHLPVLRKLQFESAPHV